jgi:acylphosphatase
MKRLHAIVEGYVQGVGFRAFVSSQANQSRLTGWVRNRWDNSVEVCAEGEAVALESFLTALWRGPAAANVRHVEVDWQEATGEFSGFRVRSSL